MRPVLRFPGNIPDNLFAGEVRAGGGQAEIADELHAGRVVGLAGEADGARANGLGLPFAGPKLVAFRDEILGPDVEPACAGWRFGTAGGAPLFFARIEIERVPPLKRIFEHAPADLMAEPHARVAVGEFEAVGIIEHLDPPHAVRQRSVDGGELTGKKGDKETLEAHHRF